MRKVAASPATDISLVPFLINPGKEQTKCLQNLAYFMPQAPIVM